MDCLFNRRVPESSASRVVLRPVAKTWVNGLTHTYDESFPKQLQGLISQSEFVHNITEINSMLWDYWPCCLCFFFGYCCCLCTLGISFLPACCAVTDARRCTEDTISKINAKNPRLRWKLVTSCSTSWIEIKVRTGDN